MILGNDRLTEIERCREQIADIERLLRDGHPDVQGLCLALSDWHAEVRLIERSRTSKRTIPPKLAVVRRLGE